MDDPRDIPQRLQEAISLGDWPKVAGLAEQLRVVAVARATTLMPRSESVDFISVEQAAKRIGRSPDFIYRDKDSLPFVKRVGKRKLAVDPIAFDRWRASRPRS